MLEEAVLEAPKVVLSFLVLADIKGFTSVLFYMDRKH